MKRITGLKVNNAKGMEQRWEHRMGYRMGKTEQRMRFQVTHPISRLSQTQEKTLVALDSMKLDKVEILPNGSPAELFGYSPINSSTYQRSFAKDLGWVKKDTHADPVRRPSQNPEEKEKEKVVDPEVSQASLPLLSPESSIRRLNDNPKVEYGSPQSLLLASKSALLTGSCSTKQKKQLYKVTKSKVQLATQPTPIREKAGPKPNKVRSSKRFGTITTAERDFATDRQRSSANLFTYHPLVQKRREIQNALNNPLQPVPEARSETAVAKALGYAHLPLFYSPQTKSTKSRTGQAKPGPADQVGNARGGSSANSGGLREKQIVRARSGWRNGNDSDTLKSTVAVAWTRGEKRGSERMPRPRSGWRSRSNDDDANNNHPHPYNPMAGALRSPRGRRLDPILGEI
jgi:hypothetical protein